MPSAPLVAQSLGFGLPFVLSLAGVAMGRSDFVKKYLLPVSWVVLSMVFSHLPFWFQRKFIFGAHVPLCIVAGVSFEMLVAKIAEPRRKRMLVAAALVAAAVTLPTQVFHLSLQRQIVGNNEDGAYYISHSLREAMKYLERESNSADLVFAAGSTSTLVPVYAGHTVLWGHWAMSVDLSERLAWKERVFGMGPTEAAGRELVKTGVKYILVDDAFRGSFGDPEPGFLAAYGKIFERGEVAVYRYEKSS